MEVSATCRNFGIILGAFRTEVEVLAELHLRYPWIQLTRRTNGAGSAILITKDDRSRNLRTDRNNINGKKFSFRPLGNQAKKAYILMGVPTCVTEELLLQDKEVLEASRMTKWNTEKTTGGIALTGATSLLRKISAGNTRLVPALKKIRQPWMLSTHSPCR